MQYSMCNVYTDSDPSHHHPIYDIAVCFVMSMPFKTHRIVMVPNIPGCLQWCEWHMVNSGVAANWEMMACSMEEQVLLGTHTVEWAMAMGEMGWGVAASEMVVSKAPLPYLANRAWLHVPNDCSRGALRRHLALSSHPALRRQPSQRAKLRPRESTRTQGHYGWRRCIIEYR